MPYDLTTWRPLTDGDVSDRQAILQETRLFLKELEAQEGPLTTIVEPAPGPVEVAEELLASIILQECRELAAAVLQEESRKHAHHQAVVRVQSRPRLQNQPVSRGDRSLSRPLP